jgi:toxin ParE1/3/4
MRELVYRKAAVRDLKEIADYIIREAGDFGAASELVDEMRRQCAKIAASPVLLGPPRDELALGPRGLLHGRYVIFFRHFDERVEIINILHGRRDLSSAIEPNDLEE